MSHRVSGSKGQIAAKFSLSNQDREQMLPSCKQLALHNLAVDKEAKGFLKGGVP